MLKDQYLSTGEAARILNISRSTVSRRFDAGQLEGKLNPMTGERLVCRRSIEETVKKHNLPVELSFAGQKHIVVGTADSDLGSLLDRLTKEDPRIETTMSRQGSDILIACARKKPDLLVIDDELPDLRGSHIVKSLRKHIDLQDIKILFCAKGVGDQPEAARPWGVDACIDTLNEDDRKRLKSTMYRLLGIPAEPNQSKTAHEHKRRWPRFPVDLDATLTAIPIGHPDRQITGRATISDISRGGACLTNILMENASFPGEPFRIMLAVDQDRLRDWKAECQLVRLQTSEPLTAGVQFDDISEENRYKIADLQVA